MIMIIPSRMLGIYSLGSRENIEIKAHAESASTSQKQPFVIQFGPVRFAYLITKVLFLITKLCCLIIKVYCFFKYSAQRFVHELTSYRNYRVTQFLYSAINNQCL